MSQVQSNKQKNSDKLQVPGVKVACGDCVGFSREILKDKKLCSAETSNIIATDKPCTRFKPDVDVVLDLIDPTKTFDLLVALMGRTPDSHLRKIGATFMRESITRSQGYYFGQKVYVRYRGAAGSNYLSNFMAAHIMYADHEMLRVGSRDGKIRMTFVGSARGAVFADSVFMPRRETMFNKGRLVDPDAQTLIARRLRSEELYELDMVDLLKGDVPTIDHVFKENGIKKSKKEGHKDMLDIANAIDSGYNVRRRRTKSYSAEEGIDVTGDN